MSPPQAYSGHFDNYPAKILERACTVWNRSDTLTPCCRAALLIGTLAGEKVATACPDCTNYWPENNNQTTV